jgi:trehalose-6-phosphate synthase
MNLVAKEFVTAQAAGGGAGALVLSEFTGAVVELREALLCNPLDVVGLAGTIGQALELDEGDRRGRIERMAAAEARRDIYWWTEEELAAAEEARPAA